MLDNGAKDGSLVTEEEEVVAVVGRGVGGGTNVLGKHLHIKNKY